MAWQALGTLPSECGSLKSALETSGQDEAESYAAPLPSQAPVSDK